MNQVTVKQLAPSWYMGTATYAGKRLAWFGSCALQVASRGTRELEWRRFMASAMAKVA